MSYDDDLYLLHLLECRAYARARARAALLRARSHRGLFRLLWLRAAREWRSASNKVDPRVARLH